MPIEQQHDSDKAAPRPGAPFIIPMSQTEQRWPVIRQVLEYARAWTQLLNLDDIRAQLENGHLQAMGVLDRSNHLVLALVRVTADSRGKQCSALLMVPSSDDDTGLRALLTELEGFARCNEASILEINTAPWMAQKVQENMMDIRQSAVVLELDLRIKRRLNS